MISSKAKALYCGGWQISFGHKKSYLLTGYTSEYPKCFFNFIVCISAIIEPLENGPLKEREVFQIIKLDNGEEGIITSQAWWGWLVLKVLYLGQKWKMKKDTAEAPDLESPKKLQYSLFYDLKHHLQPLGRGGAEKYFHKGSLTDWVT